MMFVATTAGHEHHEAAFTDGLCLSVVTDEIRAFICLLVAFKTSTFEGNGLPLL